MSHFKIFIELTRLNKPIGFMLLFWPCSWGLAFAYSLSQNASLFIYYLFLFFLGSILMVARDVFLMIFDSFDKEFKNKKTPYLWKNYNKTSFFMLYCVYWL